MLAVALPAFRELARAARSAEKLFDTLNRELPPTLEAIRLTGMEITDLTDDVSGGVQSAGQVVKQVDQSIRGVKKQAQQAQVGTRSVFAGVKAAWKTFRRSPRRLPPSSREPVSFDAAENRYPRGEQRSYAEYREEYSEEWETPLIEEEYPDDRLEAPHPSSSHYQNAAASNRPDLTQPPTARGNDFSESPPLQPEKARREE